MLSQHDDVQIMPASGREAQQDVRSVAEELNSTPSTQGGGCRLTLRLQISAFVNDHVGGAAGVQRLNRHIRMARNL